MTRRAKPIAAAAGPTKGGLTTVEDTRRMIAILLFGSWQNWPDALRMKAIEFLLREVFD